MRELPRSYYRLFINGTNEASTLDGDGNLTPPVLRIGRHYNGVNLGLTGYIAEVIAYNYRINNAQVNIINSYLAAKYNLTISGNRYAFRSTNKYDVAGIGRENGSNQHNNATSAGILNISGPGNLSDGDYMLFGHDNGSVSGWVSAEAPSDVLNLDYLRISREWRISKTNDVGTVNITGDFTNLPSITPGYSYRVLLVDSDGDFSSGAVPYPLTDIGSNKYEASGVTLNHGDYLTYAIYRINNEDPCTAQTVNVGASCNFKIYSNEGATASAEGDPGNCDGTGISGYSGGDVWFKVVVPPSGKIIINTNTESTSPSNKEWANRVGIAVYSGNCGALTKISCQISPLTVTPAGDVDLTVSGRTSGETLFLRMWEYGNNDNGKFYLCVFDPCLAPPVITGSIAPSTVEGCTVANATPAVNTVAALEALGLNISDACTPDNSLVVTHSDSFTGTCPVVVTRTYTVTDASSGSSTYNQIINVDDNTSPTVTGALTAANVEGCNTAAAPAAVTTVAALEALPGNVNISDACTADASLTVSSTDAVSGSCPTVITRTYKVTDQCGNFVNLLHTINIDDNTPPVVSGSLSPATVEGCNAAAAPAVSTVAALEALPGGITITDACTADGSLSVSHSDVVSGSCPINITRTYKVTDACGNFVNIPQDITVDDNTSPSVTGSLTAVNVEGCNSGAAPAAVNTVAALEALAGGIAISDACTADASLTVSHTDVESGACPVVITRTYKVSDACGNFVNISQTINIDDNSPPVVAGSLTPATVEGCNIGNAPAAALTAAALEAMPGGITITDACTSDALLSVSHSDAATGNCPVVVTRTYKVTDACGNFVNIVHTINVDDNTAPVVTGSLTPATVEGCSASAAPAAVATVVDLEALAGGISINDVCSPDALLTVTHSDASSGSCPLVITRTYTITDQCGNFVNVDQLINIDDNTAPVVIGSLNPTPVEGCDQSAAPAAVTTVAALEALSGSISISDACTADGLLTVSHTDVASGTCPILITRTYKISDACGNFATTVHLISIDDNTKPVVTGSLTPANVEGCDASAAPAAAATVAALELLPGGITITDACTTDALLSVSHTDAESGSCPLVITRTYKVTDVCGNFVNIVHTINVDDNTAPSVAGSLTPATVEGCNSGAAPAAVTTVAALELLPGGITITDACTPDALLSVSHTDAESGSCPLVITRTYKVTDVCGNFVNIIHTINVDDNTAPVVAGSLTPATTEGCNAAAAPAAVTTVAALESLPGSITITDACTSDAQLTVTHSDATAGNCPVVITRTYTVTDLCGNFVEYCTYNQD